MELKPGYKQTEVGVIPEDWDVKTVEELARVPSGKRMPLGTSLTDRPNAHPYIRISDMIPGTVRTSDLMYVPESVFPAIKRFRIFSQDIFISVAGSLGIVGKVPSELSGANLTENADRITDIACLQDYLLYFMMSPQIQGAIDTIRTVGAQPKLALSRIRKFRIAVPRNKAEQIQIAECLRDADYLLTELDLLITKKCAIKQAAMQELLTGKRRLPGFEGEWAQVSLGSVATMNSGGTPPTGRDDFYGGEIPWVSISDMTSSGRYISETDRTLSDLGLANCAAKRFPAGTILYAMYASLGECSIAAREVTTSQAILGIRPGSSLLGEYLYYWLESIRGAVKLMGQQGTQSNLNKKIVQGFSLSLPSKPEQVAIAKVLSEIDQDINALTAKSEKARAIKAGMMLQLLTGKIRLK